MKIKILLLFVLLSIFSSCNSTKTYTSNEIPYWPQTPYSAVHIYFQDEYGDVMCPALIMKPVASIFHISHGDTLTNSRMYMSVIEANEALIQYFTIKDRNEYEKVP